MRNLYTGTKPRLSGHQVTIQSAKASLALVLAKDNTQDLQAIADAYIGPARKVRAGTARGAAWAKHVMPHPTHDLPLSLGPVGRW